MIFRSRFPDVPIPNVALHEFVLGRASRQPDAIALVDATTGRALTYAQLTDQVRRLAAGLAARGIRKGDVLAIWSPNIPEYAVVFQTVSRIGAIISTANPTYTPEELAFQLNDANARMLITIGPLVERAREAIAAANRSIELVTIDPVAGVTSLASLMVDAEPPAVAIDPANDVVVLPYSSGTTGLPKGVMLTHRNLVSQLAQVDSVEAPDLKALLGVLPCFHIYGMVVILNFGLLRGATIVMLPRFDLEAFLRVLQDWPIALAHIVPPIMVALAKHPIVDSYNLSNVRWLLSGAAPLGTELTEAVEKRLSVKVRQGYGLTESSPATHITGPDRIRPGKAGELVPMTECCIVDPATGAMLGVGESGEVWVRGPQVMKGYLNNPEATALTVDKDGWLHTGDIGNVDAEGFLEVVDRLKELIKVKGFQVAPAELEALLLKHPQVADVAVIGVPDEEAGEVPKALVVSKGSLTADEVMKYVEGKVAHFKRVRHVSFVDAIPKSPSGKILRRVLVAAERAAQPSA